MKRGDVISWRTGRSFGRWHRLASLEPLATVCGQSIPDGALVNIAERRTDRPSDACEKCMPLLAVADRDPAPSPTIGAAQ